MGLLDWIDPISNAVNAATGFGSLVDTITGGADHRAREMARYQFDLNEKAAQNAYDRQLDFWNLQNEYNKPVNQMARYQEASINPNSAFGQVSGNAASGSSAPQAAPADVSSAMSAQYQKQALMLQSARQMAETQLIKAQKENIDADTDNKEADTKNKEAELAWIPQLRASEVNKNDAEAIKTDKERQLIAKQLTIADNQIIQIQEGVEEIRARIANINQDTLNKSLEYFQSEQSFEKLLKNMDMDIALKGAEIQHLRTQCLLILSQVTGQNLSNSYQRQINAFGAKTFNDKVAMYRFNRGLLSMDFEARKVQMPSLLNLGGINNDLDTTDKAVTILNKFFDLPNKFLDMSTKPMSYGPNFVNGVSSMGGKFVP